MDNINLDDKENTFLYLLLWNDAIERLDSLLLELRHLQQNIIYVLKTPEFYIHLRKEEKFIWFSGNEKEKKQLLDSFIDEDIDSLINKNIESYKIDINMHNGTWSTGQREHFHNLTALQELKKNIVKDKILLCKQAFKIIHNPQDESNLARFVIFRSAIISKAGVYVNRLSDQQTVFSHHFDFEPIHHPHPSINRRREQHMYTVHLDEYCHNLYKELNFYISHLEDNNDPITTPPIFHRWQQNKLSYSHSFYDEIKNSHGIHNINSSYWLPERPDLQGIIAHEIAHIIIREKYSDLSWHKLQKYNDPLARLIKLINQCIDIYVNDNTNANISLREIIVDILAATIEGVSFLYALFLELIGLDLELPFYTGEDSDRMDLGLIDNIDFFELHLISSDINYESYFRIKIVCEWIKLIHNNDDPIEKRLISSCEILVDNLYKYINSKSYGNDYDYWLSITTQICKTIKNSNLLILKTKEWLSQKEISSNIVKNERKLPNEVRIASIEAFFERFNCLFDEEEKGILKESKYFFKHVKYIPWQSSVLTSYNITSDKKSNIKEDYYKYMNTIYGHSLYSRGIYDLALEFYIHYTEPDRRKLMQVISLLKQTENNINKKDFITDSKELIGENYKPRNRKDTIEYENSLEKALYDSIKLINYNTNHLKSLYDSLELKCRKSDYSIILNALKLNNKKTLPSPNLIMKICWGGNEYDNNEETENINQAENENNTIILGIYDIFSIRNERPIYRTKLPNLGLKNEKKEEKFPSFFIIQERAYPLYFSDNYNSNGKLNIMAIISLTVQRAGARIDLVERILNIAKKNETKIEKPEFIHELAKYFHPEYGDMMYLCEGKDDLLLIFGIPQDTKDYENRLKEIFLIQNCLYQDFQIARTETIFTSICFDIAMRSNLFCAEIRIRLLEDKTLESRNKKYIDSINKEFNNYKLSITKITGRMDFSIKFNASCYNLKYGEVLKKIKNEHVDQMVTYIELKVSQKISWATLRSC